MRTQRRIHLTNFEQNLTYRGILKFYEEINRRVTVILSDIEVYDYTSSAPLFYVQEITINQFKSKVYME